MLLIILSEKNTKMCTRLQVCKIKYMHRHNFFTHKKDWEHVHGNDSFWLLHLYNGCFCSLFSHLYNFRYVNCIIRKVICIKIVYNIRINSLQQELVGRPT